MLIKTVKYLAIEARSTKDPLRLGGEMLSSSENRKETSYAKKHYRRYIDIGVIQKKLLDRGFKLLHVSESKHLCSL